MAKNLEAMEKKLANNAGSPKVVGSAIRRLQQGVNKLAISSPSRKK